MVLETANVPIDMETSMITAAPTLLIRLPRKIMERRPRGNGSVSSLIPSLPRLALTQILTRPRTMMTLALTPILATLMMHLTHKPIPLAWT